jgi:hypothetical protein
LRGPKYAMVAWLFGPMPALGMWTVLTWSGSDVPLAIRLVLAFFYVHLLFVPVGVIVLSHGPVRRCVEGRLLAVYLLAVLALGAAFVMGRDAPHPLEAAAIYTLCGTAALLPIVFVVRIAARRLAPRVA